MKNIFHYNSAKGDVCFLEIKVIVSDLIKRGQVINEEFENKLNVL